MKIYDLINGNVSQMEFLNYNNITIKYKKLSKNIKGFVFKYKDMFVIVINSYLNYHKRKKTILHELAHIELSHLYRYEDNLFEFNIDGIEDEADRYVKFLLETSNAEVFYK